jgi:hypothetical protein
MNIRLLMLVLIFISIMPEALSFEMMNYEIPHEGDEYVHAVRRNFNVETVGVQRNNEVDERDYRLRSSKTYYEDDQLVVFHGGDQRRYRRRIPESHYYQRHSPFEKYVYHQRHYGYGSFYLPYYGSPYGFGERHYFTRTRYVPIKGPRVEYYPWY